MTSTIVSPLLNGANRYAHIDAMRAAAVMLVVVAHAGIGHIVPGGSGVTIFFAISGYIITFLLLRERDKTGGFSPRGFYSRRFLKIAPPFTVIALLPTLVYALWNPVHWGAVLSQVFFVYNWIKTQALDVLPGSEVVWSLAIEEQFYIIFAIVWLFTVKSVHWKRIITSVAVLAIVYSTAARIFLAGESDRIYYGTDTRLDGIAWGVLAAIVYHTWLRKSDRNSTFCRFASSDWALALSGVAYLVSLAIRDEWFRDTFRFTLQAVAACVVILYGMLPGDGPIRRVFYRVVGLRLVNLIGLASYSIYLIHLSLDSIFRPVLADLPLLFRVPFLTVVGVVGGVIIYKLIEVPAHRFGQKSRSASELGVNSTA